MTEFILIVCGLVLGAICLGVGYLLGKKNKVIAQGQAAISDLKDIAKNAVDQAASKAKEVVK